MTITALHPDGYDGPVIYCRFWQDEWNGWIAFGSSDLEIFPPEHEGRGPTKQEAADALIRAFKEQP